MRFIRNQFTFTISALLLIFSTLHLGVGCSKKEKFQETIMAENIIIEDPETQFFYPDLNLVKVFGRGSRDTSQVSVEIPEDNAMVWVTARYTVDPEWPDSTFIWPAFMQMSGTDKAVKLTPEFKQHYLGLALYDDRYQLRTWGDRTGCDRGILCKPGDPGYWDKNVEIKEVKYIYER
jgi:hypothetical protein